MSRVRPIHQGRAAQTAERLADAALTLLADRQLSQISVADIVTLADSSVGAFYARFTCKEALIDWLCEHRLSEAAARMESRLAELDARGASIDELIDAYVDAAASFFETNTVLLREVMRMAHVGDVRLVLRRTLQANARVDREFVARVVKQNGSLSAGAARSSATFATVLVASVLRSYVLSPETLPPEEGGRRGVRLRRELAAWIRARFAYGNASRDDEP